MIRVQVIEEFWFKDYDKIENTLERASIELKGRLYIGDKFKCDKEMCDYLTDNNPFGRKFVKVIEWKPEPKKKQVNRRFDY